MKLCKHVGLSLLLLLSMLDVSQTKVGFGFTMLTEALSLQQGLNIDHNNQSRGASLLNGLRFGSTGQHANDRD